MTLVSHWYKNVQQVLLELLSVINFVQPTPAQPISSMSTFATPLILNVSLCILISASAVASLFHSLTAGLKIPTSLRLPAVLPLFKISNHQANGGELITFQWFCYFILFFQNIYLGMKQFLCIHGKLKTLAYLA